MLSAAFATTEHHITLCLRDDEEVLVTQGNLASRVAEKAVLRYIDL